MKILVITSGTGAKAVQAARPLALEDFRRGPEHVQREIAARGPEVVAAEDLYAGDQHRLLMEGVRRFRQAAATDTHRSLDLHIVSPGYGVVPGERRVAPYDVSFRRLNPDELSERSNFVGIPAAIQGVLSSTFDVAFLLLGRPYLAACELSPALELGGPTFAFGGGEAARALPPIPRLKPVPVGLSEAAAFRCPLFRLKGKIVGGWLTKLSQDPGSLNGLLAGALDPVTGWSEPS